MLGQWLEASGLNNVDVNNVYHRLDRAQTWNVPATEPDADAIQRFTDTHLTNGFLFSVDIYADQARIWRALGLDTAFMDRVRVTLKVMTGTPAPTNTKK